MSNKTLTITNFIVPANKLLSQHGKTTMIALGKNAIWVSNNFIRKSFEEGHMSVGIATELDYSVSIKMADGSYQTTADGKSPSIKGVELLEAMKKNYKETAAKVDLNIYG